MSEITESVRPDCFICGAPGRPRFKSFLLCERCRPQAGRRFSKTRGKKKRPVDVPTRAEWIEALKRSWDGSGFRCGITGVRLEADSASPRYLTLDHVAPGKRSGGWMVVAALINDMKSDLDLDEFKRVIALLPGAISGDRESVDALQHVLSNLGHWRRGGGGTGVTVLAEDHA
jgi:hypothetical protein